MRAAAALPLLVAMACTPAPPAATSLPASRPAAHRGADAVPFGPDEREQDLAFLRDTLRDAYAHVEVKRAQFGVDPDALFARLRQPIRDAATWDAYEQVMVAYVAAFHDGHLQWRRDRAPGEASRRIVRLGLATRWGGGQLVVSEVWPGSAAERAGVRRGDRIVAIDGESVGEKLEHFRRVRSWSRAEDAAWDFADEWPAAHAFTDQPLQPRRIERITTAGGRETLAILPETTPRPGGKPAPAQLDSRDGVLVLSVRSLQHRDDLHAPLVELARKIAGSHGVIVDLRGDEGGFDRAALEVAARLASHPAVAGARRVRLSPAARAARPEWRDLVEDPALPGWSLPQPVGVPGGAPDPGKVAVLVDAGCRSSCETLALLLRAAGGRLIGDTTGGTSGGPIEVILPQSKARIEVPVFAMFDPRGTPIEGHGVTPDEIVAATADDIAAGRDAVLERALEWVKEPMDQGGPIGLRPMGGGEGQQPPGQDGNGTEGWRRGDFTQAAIAGR